MMDLLFRVIHLEYQSIMWLGVDLCGLLHTFEDVGDDYDPTFLIYKWNIASS